MFTLIIIRVGLNETTSEFSRGGDPTIGAESRIGAPPVHAIHASQYQQYPMRPLAINVSVSRTHDRASFEAYDGKDAVRTKKDPDLESGDDTIRDSP